MIVITVMHSQFMQVLPVKFTPATATYPGKQFERHVTIRVAAFIALPASFCNNPVQFVRFFRFSVHTYQQLYLMVTGRGVVYLKIQLFVYSAASFVVQSPLGFSASFLHHASLPISGEQPVTENTSKTAVIIIKTLFISFSPWLGYECLSCCILNI